MPTNHSLPPVERDGCLYRALTDDAAVFADSAPTPPTVDVELELPSYIEEGEATVVAVVNGVVGARLSPFSTLYNATVTVGKEEAKDTVTSGEGVNLL